MPGMDQVDSRAEYLVEFKDTDVHDPQHPIDQQYFNFIRLVQKLQDNVFFSSIVTHISLL